MPRTIALDFDGVIHSYTSGWKGADIIPDPPVPGAIDFIKMVLANDNFELAIYSTRTSADENGLKMAEKAAKAIVDYLGANGLTREETNQIAIMHTKPKAVVYIDDRAWPFEGSFPTLGMIGAFRPWNKR